MIMTMYDNLLQLPLFQGLCKEDFTTIIERVRLNFITLDKGETFIRQGDPCRQLTFLLNGEITANTQDEANGYTLTETLGGPYIIEPYSLFGMNPRYTATYRAKNQAGVLSIDKAYIYSELNKYEIFRINYLNLLSNRCQNIHQKLWHTHSGKAEEKFLHFLLLRCQNTDGEKVLKITMENLSQYIDETRISVSRMLNEMQDKGIVQLKRGKILIPDIERLSGPKL